MRNAVTNFKIFFKEQRELTKNKNIFMPDNRFFYIFAIFSTVFLYKENI